MSIAKKDKTKPHYVVVKAQGPLVSMTLKTEVVQKKSSAFAAVLIEMLLTDWREIHGAHPINKITIDSDMW